MYEPLFNTVVVEIDDKEAAWGGSKDESAGLLGQSYNKGTLRAIASEFFPFGDTSDVRSDGLEQIGDRLVSMVGQKVLWNKGHEGDNLFENDGKKYAIMFWWDLMGVALPGNVSYDDDGKRQAKKPENAPRDKVSISFLEKFTPQRIERIAKDDGLDIGVEPIHNGGFRGECPITAEDDITATRQALKKAGVPNWETIEIVGGGHGNNHVTGIR